MVSHIAITMAKQNISLQDFLKKYSLISNAFIDDLFSLYGPSTQQSDHVVDLDAVAKWLEVRRHNLVLTLRESYDHNKNRKPRQKHFK